MTEQQHYLFVAELMATLEALILYSNSDTVKNQAYLRLREIKQQHGEELTLPLAVFYNVVKSKK